MNEQKRCINCMNPLSENTAFCPHCGFSLERYRPVEQSLPPHTMLSGRYEIGRVLGRGGFGITYVGYDHFLNQKVALKEYFPRATCVRQPSTGILFWSNEQYRQKGCESLLREARKMAAIDRLPATVRIWNILYANNTAYIVMDFVEGITLKDWLMKNSVMSAASCAEMLHPVMESLEMMNKKGIIHRDISPDNIMVEPSGKARLVDLGAAFDLAETGEENAVMVARVGFSPPEQYRNNGPIGPWTDVYSMTATIYYCLLGKVPAAAPERENGRANLQFRFPDVAITNPEVQKVLEHGMALSPDQRIPGMLALSEALKQAAQKNASATQSFSLGHTMWINPFHRHQAAPQQKPLSQSKEKTVSEPIPLTPQQDGQQQIAELPYIPPNQPLPASMRLAYLIIRRTGRPISLTKSWFVLGRMVNAARPGAAQPADGMIEDPSKHISRSHAAIACYQNRFYLVCLSSKNITRLNGQLVEPAEQNAAGFAPVYPLQDGDIIHLAKEELIFHIS